MPVNRARRDEKDVSLDSIVAVNSLDWSNADIVIEPFLYGVYTLLFTLSLYLLFKRQQKWLRWHVSTMILLYSLATVHVALFLRTATSRTEDEWNKFDFGGASVFIIINIVTDLVLIVRCYAMMGFRKRWVAPAFVSWVCTIAFGIVTLVLYNKIHWVIPGAGQVTTTITIFLAIFTNVLVTFFSAGRIWWITRTSGRLIDNTLQKQYHRIVAIILESGIINPCLAAVYGSLFFLPVGPTRFAALRCMSVVLSQSCGMIPTLIIVRAALGWSVVAHDGTTMVSTFDAATAAATGPIFTTQFSVNGLSIMGDVSDVTGSRDCVV